jgi:hypothetical protein
MIKPITIHKFWESKWQHASIVESLYPVFYAETTNLVGGLNLSEKY